MARSSAENKKVILIKLGGAIITDKSIPNTVRPDVLKRLVKEIKKAQSEIEPRLVIGHGAGSFAHVPALKYDTMNGFKDDESRLGMAIVQDSAAQLNRIVVSEFLKADLPAVSSCCSSSVVTKNKQVESYFTDVFRQYLKQGLLPVSYGDVIVDSEIGCTIWSTDKILTYFCREFLQHGWEVEKIVHVTQVAGVYHDLQNPSAGIFEEITPHNAEEVQKAMGVTKGFDVTGGMWNKIAESLDAASQGVETTILAGETPNALYNCLTGKPFVGTRIHA